VQKIPVNQEEFENFLDSYPKGALKADVYRISEPAVLTYNDFSDGKKWPESIVASVTLNRHVAGTNPITIKENDLYIYK